MNCETFESLMADALGDELAPGQHPAFDEHLAACTTCRQEFESLRATAATMHSLPGPQRVTVRREGSRLVLEERSDHQLRLDASHQKPSTAASSPLKILRYAAGLLIAFTGGYGFHAVIMARDAIRTAETIVQADKQDDGETSLQGSIVQAHSRKPKRSDLAKCLIAMSARKR